MNIPSRIVCASGEIALAVAQYLEVFHGFKLDNNLKRLRTDPNRIGGNPGRDEFFDDRAKVISVYNDRKSATWKSSTTNKEGAFKSLREFLDAINEVQRVKLNDTYTAEVGKDETKVGCQTFKNSVILELAEAIRKQ